MSKFFISYTGCDKAWAEWIAWQIEDAGHKAVMQAWDFGPGSNFVLEMQKAAKSTSATIAVLSKDYIEKPFPSSEWAAAFVKDPSGQKNRLIPVRISDVEPDGLLSSIVYIDLFNVSEELATTRLLEGISGMRRKPNNAPTFPQNISSKEKPAFPSVPKSKRNVQEINVEAEIQIRLNQEFDRFTPHQQERILSALSELLNINYDIKVLQVKKGSVLITIALKKSDALKLYILNHIGDLRDYGITDLVVQRPVDVNTIDDALEQYNKTEPVKLTKGQKESGTIVYMNRKAHYGIIRRHLGGYLKFYISEGARHFGLGSEVNFDANILPSHFRK